MKVLVTGGAGYIGSGAVKTLLENGHQVSVVDNLSRGRRELIPEQVRFFKNDLTQDLTGVFKDSKYDAVIHFAAYKAVEESMTDAVKYSDNITGTINLLNYMVKYNVPKIIFSSTAAVYGESNEVLTENSKTDPANFYGFSKLECERIIEWYNKIHGINFTNLRYFNVAGDVLGYVDPNAKNVFPIIIETINGKRNKFTIFGNDYDTKDGTCIRDYIHVQDLVDAHILCLDSNYNGVINIGSGNGFSENELIESFKRISKKDFPVAYLDRRPGDAICVIASNQKAKSILSWTPKKSLNDMITSSLEVWK